MVKFGILIIYASLYFYETIYPFLCVKGKRAGRNYHFIHAPIEMVHFFNPISTRGLFKRLFQEQTLYLKLNLLSWSVGLCEKTHRRTVDGWFLTSVSQFYVIFLESWLTDIISWFSHFSLTAPEGTYPRRIRDAFRQLVSTSFFQKKGFHLFHAKPMRLFDV